MSTEDLIILDDAIITPTTVSVNKLMHNQYLITGAVYDKNGSLINSSQRNSTDIYRDNNPHTIDKNSFEKNISEVCIYMGLLTNHYGHFLVESLSRFWVLYSNLNIKFKYIIFNMWIADRLNKDDYIDNFIFKYPLMFNLENEQILILEERVKCKKLFLPFPSFIFTDIPTPILIKQSIPYEFIVKNARKYHTLQKFNQRIYITRPYGCERISNHLEIEIIFRNYGFEIINPYDFSFVNQIAIYSNCDIIATIEGTGSHNSVFMNSGKHLIVIGSLRNKFSIHSIQQNLSKLNDTKMHLIEYKDNKLGNGIDLEHVKSKLDFYLHQL
jgi:capsular polysaccharide biosynthesis protein